jgi:hypothetical protein
MPSFRNYKNISYYDAAGKQLCYVDSTEATRKVAEGDHEMFCVSCRKVKGEGVCLTLGRSNHLMALRQVKVEKLDDKTLKPRPESDSSLTQRDMTRNVGITEGFPGAPADTGQVAAAQHRIHFWGWASAHNARAVIVVPATA